ncbi:hypothetical protein U27_02548 [Candidatus Vecturithrix granuli]|uniref:Glycosyltransferase RgtA/B/C/D-like domain-containing protein n=1 Tax=Vecturithrix granuli TaxID=1499967 RepID=A0A081CAW4_VECG1|nr:hypothetical protein U27_02548 [Candidatus Vecturithrix granuli]
MKKMIKPFHWHISGLLFLCILAFGFNIDQNDFWKWQEDRRPEISREMVASGDWLIPRLNGMIFTTKPPLYYWSVAASFCLSGKFDEMSARVPSLLSAIGGVLITYCWANALLSARIGLLAGIMLTTTFLYVLMARMAQIDMLLTMFTTASLACFSVGMHKRKTGWYYLGYVCAGLGALTKNPIGVVIPFLAVLGFILVTRQFRLIREMKPCWGGIIVLLIVLPWYIAVYQRYPEVLEVVWTETVGRYVDPENTPRLEPFYYYLPVLFTFAPWILFLPGAVMRVVRDHAQKVSLFLLIAAMGIFLLFSSVGSKKSYYLLPMAPVLAMLSATVWDDYLTRPFSELSCWRRRLMTGAIFFSLSALCLVGTLLPVASFIYLPQQAIVSTGVGIVLCCLGVSLFLTFRRGMPWMVFGLYVTAVLILYLFTVKIIIPPLNAYASHKPFFQETARIVGDQKIVAYKYTGADAHFYMQRVFPNFEDVKIFEQIGSEKGTVFVIIHGNHYDKLQREQPHLMKHLQIVFEYVMVDRFQPGKSKRLLLLQTKSAEDKGHVFQTSQLAIQVEAEVSPPRPVQLVWKNSLLS